jgi:hypothetical protein
MSAWLPTVRLAHFVTKYENQGFSENFLERSAFEN